MKTKLISIKSISILAIVVLFALGTSLARPGRAPISLTGDVLLTGPKTATGTVTGKIQGQSFNATVDVTIIQGPVEIGDGVQFVNEIEHVFTTSNGSFTTTGKEILTPTRTPMLYILNGYMKITGGTGEFDGASGEMSVHGMIDFSTGEVDYDSHGSISL